MTEEMNTHKEKLVHLLIFVIGVIIGIISIKGIISGGIIASIVGVIGFLFFSMVNFIIPIAVLKHPTRLIYYGILILLSVYCTAEGNLILVILGGLSTAYYSFLMFMCQIIGDEV